ncbi:unnamed protein product [Cladocopium goreaui]|uniref:Uncharacterized protein n=1 Tax=Cladocopium goreaui TaxID=2562237 RepID=A0A9P1BLE2_9DINO|nr:unnamed protein product [Cladocopium goreaui]
MAMDGSIGLRFVGLYSTDAKVPMIQKAPPFNSVPLPCAEIQIVTLITSCASATGCASLLLARLGFSAISSAILGGAAAWPFGLLVKALRGTPGGLTIGTEMDITTARYEWRPWSPAHIDMNEASKHLLRHHHSCAVMTRVEMSSFRVEDLMMNLETFLSRAT